MHCTDHFWKRNLDTLFLLYSITEDEIECTYLYILFCSFCLEFVFLASIYILYYIFNFITFNLYYLLLYEATISSSDYINFINP